MREANVYSPMGSPNSRKVLGIISRRALGIALVSLMGIAACTTDIKDINNLVEQNKNLPDIGTNIEMLYSDSALVKVRILSPTMKRYTLDGQSIDEFTDGLKVEFLNENKRVTSWLEADYALRKDNEKKVYVERNVILYNKNNDKLETDELVWDEEAEEVYTSRPVKISQPSRGDTSFGYGFKADQEFTRFEIKRKFSAIKNVEELR